MELLCYFIFLFNLCKNRDILTNKVKTLFLNPSIIFIKIITIIICLFAIINSLFDFRKKKYILLNKNYKF